MTDEGIAQAILSWTHEERLQFFRELVMDWHPYEREDLAWEILQVNRRKRGGRKNAK